MLGLVVVVAPALVVALAPAVVAVAPVTLQAQYSRFPCYGPPGAAHPACKLEVLSSSCSATVLLLQFNSH